MFISEHTVDSHVRTIMNKPGFNSRAQIAAWMAASGP
ncbi:LuxR C-terminal-related transcriptional regulator [Planobispora rosea]|nr:LuxR C-terminal-related transcriptional regulator [Planobispora rosea]